MTNKKCIKKASIRFAKQNPALHRACQVLCSRMAKFIAKSGATEVAVGFKNSEYYEHAIDQDAKTQ